MFRCLLISFALLLNYFSSAHFVGTMQIKDFVLTKCDTTDYPISLTNVTVELGNHYSPMITGIFTTNVDLISPITVSMEVKRKVVFWIEVPCVDNIGSCTYKDACNFGTPANKTCPAILIKNQVPCRCPIKKGTYVIPESFGEVFQNTAIYSGKYWARVVVEQKSGQLGCYNAAFELYDS